MAERTITGTCLCGAVGVTLSGAKSHVEICQCVMCRRWSGGLYSAQKGADASVTGEDKVARYQSSDWGERAFCTDCGSHIWWRFKPTGDRSFSAGLFDDAVQHGIEKEIFTDEAARWTRLAGDHPRQTGAEVIAEAEAGGLTFD